MEKTYYLAIDIGASSGRHIIGWKENGKLKTDEVYRFPNQLEQLDGHLIWNIKSLLAQVKTGIAVAKEKYPTIKSLAIDTWGVDYVLLNGDEEIYPVYAYRDSRTKEVMDEVHGKISFERLYKKTGCQFQPFNTIYQLYDDLNRGRLETATDFLMIPEYLSYKLTGNKKKEYTNSTTTGMISAETSVFDKDVIQSLGLPEHLFPTLVAPGTKSGEYEGIDVILCASHDTASAVEGIPMEGNELYISSGTWSLLGVKTLKPITSKRSMEANYSNEGGVGYNRYQKNIMGMWVVNELRKELCPDKPFNEIVKEATESNFNETVDVNESIFLSPESMTAAFESKLKQKPVCIGDFFRCAYLSLAQGYHQAIKEIEDITGCQYEKLYIVGGGAKNQLLNQLTEEKTGKKVIALAIEATAIGNLKIQMEESYEL